jgi:lipooligosaccharide transport system ATP-binding protein
MEETLIKATGLRKEFGDFVAVDGIDFEVRKGEAFGFLGPNGAGKTSTMKMIGAVSPISGGTISVLGLDPATEGPRLRSRLGVVPQDNNLDEELTVSDTLIMYGRSCDLSRSVL